MTDWSFSGASPAKRVFMIATLVSVATAAILGGANVAQLGEPYWVATRGFVSYKLQEATAETKATLKDATTRSITIEIRIEDGARRQIKNKIGELELELEKNPNTPESLRRLIQQQIDQHKEDLGSKEETIRNLRRLQQLQMQK